MINIGDYYNRTSDFQHYRWVELLELAEGSGLDFKNVKAILDLGCGSGQRTKELLRFFPKVDRILGIDLNPSMIETARRINFDQKITYMVSDIVAPEWGNFNSFDLVVANYVLHWIADKDKLFKALEQVVHKKTTLLIATSWEQSLFFSTINRAVRDHLGLSEAEPSPFHHLNEIAWKDFLGKFDWKIETFKKRQKARIVSRGNEFLKHWYSASTAKAFYGKPFNFFEGEFLESLNQKLDMLYASPDNSEKWVYPENPLLIVAKKPL